MLFTLFTLLPLALGMTLPMRSCPVSSVKVPLIAGLEVPAGEKTVAIGLGRGTQNYTCTAGKYVSAGAVANLYDASCIVFLLQPVIGPDMPSDALTSSAIRLLDYPDQSKLPVKLDHFFTRTAAGGIAPVFRDPATGQEVIGAVTTRVDAKDPATNVPWLRLTGTSGVLAKSVFRTHTVKGQPPTSVSWRLFKLT